MTQLTDGDADLYTSELDEHVEGLDHALLVLERTYDAEAVAAAFRHLHSVKGAAAAMGFPAVQNLAHSLEDAFSVVREHGEIPSADLISLSFEANDQFRRHLQLLHIDGAASPDDDVVDTEDLLNRIAAAVTGGTLQRSGTSAETPSASDADPETRTVPEILNTPEPLETLTVQLDGSLPLIDLKARSILRRLAEVVAVGDTESSLDNLDTVGFQLHVPLLSPVAADDLREALTMEGVQSWRLGDSQDAPVQLSPPEDEIRGSATAPDEVKTFAPPASTSPTVASSEAGTVTGVTSLRVGVAALDLLADLAGELVTVRSRLTDTVGSVASALDMLSAASSTDALAQRLNALEVMLPAVTDRAQRMAMTTTVAEMRVANDDLQVSLRQIETHAHLKSELVRVAEDVSSVVGRLQEATIDLRLVPLESVFRRFRRVVRDAAHASGKQVNLTIRGEGTGVDKRLIDGLAEPLTHLVRNAVDHGLESVDDRQRLGKPAQGQLLLSAAQQGNSVVIELRDDGRGIDVEQVRNKLITDGRVEADRAAQLTRDDLIAFLFLAGVTTKDAVTELSGRGVGLDAVQSMISRLHGTVELQTEHGVGTTVSLRLPSAMAIVHSLIVTIGEHHLGIPIEDVREVVSLDEVTLTPVGEEQVLLLRGEFLPVVEIQDRLNLAVGEGPLRQRFAVILSTGLREVACLIDQAVGTEDLVIKSIGDSLGNRKGLSGASFLGDGNVALILDSSALTGAAL